MDDDNKISLRSTPMRMYLDQQREQWKTCARRVDRVQLEPSLHPAWIGFPEHSKVFYPIQTIAELGAACWISGLEKMGVDPSRPLQVALAIESERFVMEARVRALHGDGIAVEFMNPTQRAREKIRAAFKPELLAATLSPILSYTNVEPGASATLIYSDGDLNWLQLVLSNGKTLGVQLNLEILDLHLEWKKSEFKKSGSFTGETAPPQVQKKVLSFVRNLRGMDSGLYKEIEQILTTGRLV